MHSKGIGKGVGSRKKVFGPVSFGDFKDWERFKDSYTSGWILFLMLVLALTGAMVLKLKQLPSNIEVGSISQWDIHADRNYEIVDESATTAQREQAITAVRPIYDWKVIQSEILFKKMEDSFAEARKYIDINRSKLSSGLWLQEDFVELAKIFKNAFGIDLDDSELQVLIVNQFSPWMKNSLVDLTKDVVSKKIISDPTTFADDIEGGIVVRVTGADGGLVEKTQNDSSALVEVNDARKLVRADSPKMRRLRLQTRTTLASIAQKLVQPNLIFNEEETVARRARASEEVKDIIVKVQEGESIIRRGDRFNPWHVTVIDGIRMQKEEAHFKYRLAGTSFLTALFLLAIYEFASRYIRKFRVTKKDMIFCGGLLVLVILIARLSFRIAGIVHGGFSFDIPIEALYFGIPVAFGAMLVRLVLNSEVAVFFSIAAAVLVGFAMPENNFHYTVYFFVSGIVAASTIAFASRRSSVFKAGLITGIVNVLMVVAISLADIATTFGIFTWEKFGWEVGLAFFGGIFTAVLVTMFAPVSEVLFDYLTNIKLLELGSLDHPLLRELIVRAPGTYHHSHMVGTLAEAACEVINANPLYARVASYFHDIGKMKKPDYFMENQSEEVNRHENLSPSMSALIISSHVKDGVEMAKEHKLPKKITDVITQHQGTKLISYFFIRAKELGNKQELQNIDEKDYRYPGPKPQSREIGVVLLADTVEAATRSLTDRSPARLQQVVQNMINQNFIDGQLDESDLTLRDLHEISNAFTRILTAVYHQRIDYPALTKEKGKKVVNGDKIEKTDKYTKPKPIQDGGSFKGGKDHGEDPGRSGPSDIGN